MNTKEIRKDVEAIVECFKNQISKVEKDHGILVVMMVDASGRVMLDKIEIPLELPF